MRWHCNHVLGGKKWICLVIRGTHPGHRSSPRFRARMAADIDPSSGLGSVGFCDRRKGVAKRMILLPPVIPFIFHEKPARRSVVHSCVPFSPAYTIRSTTTAQGVDYRAI